MFLLKPFCKINLFLDVLNKREDGYHEILTIFQSIDLYDEILIKEDETLHIDFNSNDYFIDPLNNTIKKAYYIFKEEYLKLTAGKWQDFYFSVKKNIPSGAGLGGGNADGAAVLNFLNSYYGYPFDEVKLREISLKIGADTPFLIEGGSAIGRGIGEILDFFNVDGFEMYKVFIISPEIHISTKEAYDGISKYLTKEKKYYNIYNLIERPERIFGSLKDFYNIFEKSIFQKYPLLKEIKGKILRYDPLLVLMTGSGSSIFAIFENEDKFNLLKEEFGGNRIFFTTPITREKIKKQLLTKL